MPISSGGDVMDQASRSIASKGFNPIILHSSKLSCKIVLARSEYYYGIGTTKGGQLALFASRVI